MKANELIKGYLADHGWQYKGDCRCSGIYTLKFQLNTGQGEFNLRVRASSFLISKPDTRFAKFPISELKNKIDEIFETYKISIQKKDKV